MRRTTTGQCPTFFLGDKMFTPAETAACFRLIELALLEDFGPHPPHRGDVTSFLSIPPGYQGRARVVSRKAGVAAGLPAAALVCGAVDPQLQFQQEIKDGDN